MQKLGTWVVLTGGAWLALAACGPVQKRVADDGIDPAQVPALLDPASLASADPGRGELLGLACQACHTFEADAKNNIGPNLYGIFGRAAAGRADFAYSEALRASGLVWTPSTVDRWLSDPAGFIDGSSMTFAGYADPTDRRDLIAYLLSVLTPSTDGRGGE